MSKANDPRVQLYALFDSTRETIQKAVKLELAQYQMSQSQVKVMHMLSQNAGGLTINQLSESVIRELNSVTTLINRMQKKGLVRKEKRKGDNKTYIILTDKGMDIYNNTVTEHSITLIFETLSEEERKQLTFLLSKLQSKARTLLGLDYKPPFLIQD
jgi:DNA-binding MarR family transcriptional regulator